MKGWIYGTEHQKQWTQKIYKKSFKFQNPLHQNYKHHKALEAILQVDPEAIFSVIVFTGDSTFKTQVPPNVTYSGGVISFVESKSDSLLDDNQVKTICQQIEDGRLVPNRQTHKAHVTHVKEIVATKPQTVSCPKCGSEMVKRTVKKEKEPLGQSSGVAPGFRNAEAFKRYLINIWPEIWPLSLQLAKLVCTGPSCRSTEDDESTQEVLNYGVDISTLTALIEKGCYEPVSITEYGYPIFLLHLKCAKTKSTPLFGTPTLLSPKEPQSPLARKSMASQIDVLPVPLWPNIRVKGLSKLMVKGCDTPRNPKMDKLLRLVFEVIIFSFLEMGIFQGGKSVFLFYFS